MPRVTPHSVLSHGVIAIKDVIGKINETWVWTGRDCQQLRLGRQAKGESLTRYRGSCTLDDASVKWKLLHGLL